GASWTTISDWRSTTSTRVYVHADQHNFLWRPGTTNEVISTSDGGVSYCTNITSTSVRANFADHNKDYNVTQFYAVAMKNIANSDHLLAGAQDNGTQIIRTGGIASSSEVTGGDGAFCFADQDTPDNQISSYVYNAYYRTINDWNSYGSLSGTGGLFINPADLDDTNDILYASSSANSMMRYSNIFTNSPSTEQVSVNTGGSTISAVHVDAFNPNRVYVGTFSGNLFRIDNANTATPSVTTVTGTMNTGTIKGIDVSSAGEIIVVSSSYGEASVWFSPDGGTTWVDKDEAAHGLPDMPVRDVLFDPNNSDRVLLATEVGVWSSDDVKASNPGWEPTSIDLANVRCDMFKYRESDGLVAVATYGRGVFTTDIFDPISCAPPTALMLSNGTTSTVDVSWTAGASETAWEIEYGTTGFTLGTGTNATVTSTTYALTGLVGGGQYEFYVRAICGPSDNSSWSKISIQTELCDLSSQCTYQIVLSDSYGDSWNGGEISILQNGIQTHTFGTELPNGSASVSVSFNVCDGANLEVKVVSTGLYPSEMGFEIYDNFGILVDELPQGSSFANGDILMAFGVNCAGGCYKPVSLAATSVGTTQIGVTWVGNSPSAIGYEVEYGPIGFTQGTGTTVSVSGTSYTITGLTASTGYDVYVSSLCSGARQSDATLLSVYTFPCQTTDQCDYSFTLLDDYGDGWNGALIDVVQYGTPTTLLGDGFTTGGSQLVSGVKICHGATVSLVVRENGSFSYEIGLEANNEMGTLVGSHPDGASFADGATLFSFRGQCTSELSVSLSPTQVLEDDDQLSFMFTFTSSRVALEDIRVNFNVGGTATYNNDYYLVRGANTFTATLGSVIIPAGQTSVTLVLQSQQDAIEEGDETIILSLLSVE
ncbi:MAG: fibronectin type III domain-containing protein, partial [Bacteroidota bacterium]